MNEYQSFWNLMLSNINYWRPKFFWKKTPTTPFWTQCILHFGKRIQFVTYFAHEMHSVWSLIYLTGREERQAGGFGSCLTIVMLKSATLLIRHIFGINLYILLSYRILFNITLVLDYWTSINFWGRNISRVSFSSFLW